MEFIEILSGRFFLQTGLQTPLFLPLYLGILFSCLVIAALVYYFLRVKSFRNNFAKMESIILEKSELLQYMQDKEKKLANTATHANTSRSELITKLSHEIRTPLNGVLGMASLLAETGLNEEQTEYTQAIRSSGEHLLAVINEILMHDILDVSKQDGGKAELEQQDVDIRSCVEDVLEMFQAKAGKKGIELLYNIDDKVPGIISGDSQRLRQVLINLVENALRHTVQGQVMIDVYPESGADVNQSILGIDVKDSGPGMQTEKLLQLSKTLAQDQGNEIPQGGATGYGLIICNRLVKKMGGQLSLHNSRQSGLVAGFTFRTTVAPVTRLWESSLDISLLQNKNILVASNNESARTNYCRRITQLKAGACAAKTGKNILSLLSSSSDFDMVLVDSNLPDMEATNLAEQVRQKFPAIPVICITTSGELDALQHTGVFTSVLAKPVRQAMLIDHLLSAFRQKTGNATENKSATQLLSEDFSQEFPLRILVAEDNLINQQLAGKILKKMGYDPVFAENGKEVLALVSHAQFDIILMDVQMPEMDGLEATRMIRLCLSSQPVIIAMTANTMQGDREEYLQSGMDDYISKPIHLEELVRQLRKWATQLKERVGN